MRCDFPAQFGGSAGDDVKRHNTDLMTQLGLTERDVAGLRVPSR